MADSHDAPQRYRLDVEVVLGTDVWREELAAFAGGRHGGRGLALIGTHSAKAAERCGVLPALRSMAKAELVVPDFYLTPPQFAEWLSAHWSGAPADWVVAVGGTRVIDSAKLLALRGQRGEAIRDYETPRFLQRALNSGDLQSVPTCAIPMAPGPGAESSAVADVLVGPGGTRSPVMSPALFMSQAIIDSRLVHTAAPHVVASALLQAVMHVVDPWVNSLGRLSSQTITASQVLGELSQIARKAAAGPLDSTQALRLVRLSHLALRPGVIRTSGHVAAIHRIEHALSPTLFDTHSQALGNVAVRFFRWLERNRADVLRPFAAELASSLGEALLPSELIQRLCGSLGITLAERMPSGADAETVLTHLRNMAPQEATLPGDLAVPLQQVGEILSERVPAVDTANGYDPLLRRWRPDGHRVFGSLASSTATTLVVTPIAPVFSSIEQGARTPPGAWYPSLIMPFPGGQAMIIKVPVGASALVDALDLAAAWLPRIERAVFLGLAGAIDDSLALGRVLRPVRAFGGCGPTGIAVSGQAITVAGGTDDVGVASVAQLRYENDATFRYLRWLGASLIDLESASFCRWCRDNQVPAAVLLAVSDHVRQSAPIWSLDHKQANVIQKASGNLVGDLRSYLSQSFPARPAS